MYLQKYKNFQKIHNVAFVNALLCFLCFAPSISFATKRLAVLEFEGVGVDEEIVGLLADDVRIGVLEGIANRLVDNEEILVMTRENMMEFMKEMDKDPMECSGECEVEVARNIGADYLISGKIVQIQNMYVLHLKLHESSRGELLAGEQARENDITKMLDTAITSGRTLIQKGLVLTDDPNITSAISQRDVSIQSNHSKDTTKIGLKSNEDDIIVTFESYPAGAEVFVNGKFLCSQTPCQKYLAPQTYEIRFDLPRYQEEILKNVDLSKSKNTAKIQKNLQPLFGYVHVTSQPSGIELFLKGQSDVWTKTPVTKEIDPGSYIVESKNPCFEPYQQEFHVNFSDEVFVDVQMQPVLVPIKVFVYDGEKNALEANVFVDGHESGRAGSVLNVPLCSRELEIQNGSRTWKESLYLDQGQSPEINIDIQQKSANFDYDMVLVPKGSFVMGCTEDASKTCENDEFPAYQVSFSQNILMGKYEVTQGLYQQVMGVNPSSHTTCGSLCPVESVSWYEVIQFVNRMSDLEGLERCYAFVGEGFSLLSLDCNGYRLPTEAEWEYAARGGKRYVFAGSHRIEEVGWSDLQSGKGTHLVGQKAPNGYGLYDMSGNVSEWVWDWYDVYPTDVAQDPMGAKDGYQRVIRGGAWNEASKEHRVNNRIIAEPSFRSEGLGFRVCRRE